MLSNKNYENEINKLKEKNKVLRAKLLDLCNDIKECKGYIQDLRILIKKKVDK